MMTRSPLIRSHMLAIALTACALPALCETIRVKTAADAASSATAASSSTRRLLQPGEPLSEASTIDQLAACAATDPAASQKLATMKQGLADLTTERDALDHETTDLAPQPADIAAEQARLAQSAKQIKDKEDELAQRMSVLNQTKHEAVNNDSDFKKMNQKITDFNEDVAHQDKQRQTFQKDQDALVTKTDAYNARVKELNRRSQLWNTQHAAFHQALEAFDQSLAPLQQKCAKKRASSASGKGK